MTVTLAGIFGDSGKTKTNDLDGAIVRKFSEEDAGVFAAIAAEINFFISNPVIQLLALATEERHFGNVFYRAAIAEIPALEIPEGVRCIFAAETVAATRN